MSDSRNTNTQEAKVEATNSTVLLKLNQSARNGKVLGIGLCTRNPSGCFDITKGTASGVHNVPYIRIQCERSNLSQYKFLDEPPKFTTPCETVFFTGCVLSSSTMVSVLESLTKQYQFTNIRHVYQIIIPHLSCGISEKRWKASEIANKALFKKHHLNFNLVSSGLDANSLFNIGIPRLELNPSEFKIPAECFGVTRFSNPISFNASFKQYLNEFFRQVANAGKNSANKPMAIAIGIKPYCDQMRILDLAAEHSINIDFCNKYPKKRLPHQNDFLKLLSVMKDRKAIVSFDDVSTQSLLQALSFGVSVLICSQNNTWPKFYDHLVKLVPIEYQPIAKVILGLSDDYELLKDGEKCQKVYELLHLAVNDAHKKFDNFITVSTPSSIPHSNTPIAPTDLRPNDEKTSSMNSSSVACSGSSSSSFQQSTLFANSKKQCLGSNAKTQLSKSLIPR